MILKTALVFFFSLSISALAEDWEVHGKTYRNVVVKNVYAERVEITFDGGVGSPALADLAPELQARFKYDPAKAKAEAASREKAAATARATAEDQNPSFLREWTEKIQKEAYTAVTATEKRRAEIQGTRLEIFTKLFASTSSNYERDAIKNWMDAVMTDCICNGMPKALVLCAWGPPKTTTNYSDGDETLFYGNGFEGMVHLSNGVVKRWQTTSSRN